MPITSIPGQISVDYQSLADVDGVYVTGSTPAGSGPFWSSQFPGQGLLPMRQPPRMAMIGASQATDQKSAAAAALAYLSHVQSMATIGVLVTGSDGWAKGQALLITHAVFGWSAKPFVIVAVNMTVKTGTGIRQYTLTCGSDPLSATRWISAGGQGGSHRPLAATRIMGTLTPGGRMPDSV